MVVPAHLRGRHGTVATDSLGGASIGRVAKYSLLIETGAEPAYAAGSPDPYVVTKGNYRYSGSLSLHMRDLNEVFTLLTNQNPNAQTQYVRISTGVSGDQIADFTVAGVEYSSHGMEFDNTGAIINEVHEFDATGVTLGVPTV